MRQQITGNLLGDEPVHRDIITQALDHIVAIAPRIFERQRTSATGGLGEPCHIKPM
jgi:hypothetical protein